MTDTDDLLQRLRSLSRCEHSDLSIGDEAADEIERLRAQVTKLRALAADAYQAAGAHDWPVEWLDALSAAASALPFSIDGLLPMATPELVARATRAESELAAIKLRLIEDCDAARDFPANTCGASRHAQMIAESLISGVPYAMLTDDPAYCGQSILSTVKSLFTARTELTALRGRIAASPVVCIDNGACVTDGARLTIAGGDTYFVHAELCGKRVRLVVEQS